MSEKHTLDDKFEPEVRQGFNQQYAARLSIAISLKRNADTLAQMNNRQAYPASTQLGADDTSTNFNSGPTYVRPRP